MRVSLAPLSPAAAACALVPALAACTEPTWYPGLPTGVVADSGTPGDGGSDAGGSDSGFNDSGGSDSGGSDSGGDAGTDTGGGGLPCSDPAGAAATLTVDVQADLGLILWWRAEDCAEYSYGAVPPYVPRDQGTYVGHVWVLRDAVGAYHDHLTVTETAQTWEVTE